MTSPPEVGKGVLTIGHGHLHAGTGDLRFVGTKKHLEGGDGGGGESKKKKKGNATTLSIDQKVDIAQNELDAVAA